MLYGKNEIIKYIIEHLISLNFLDKTLEMKTKDNRFTLLCLLKFEALIEEKKAIFFRYFSTFSNSYQ